MKARHIYLGTAVLEAAPEQSGGGVAFRLMIAVNDGILGRSQAGPQTLGADEKVLVLAPAVAERVGENGAGGGDPLSVYMAPPPVSL